MLVLKNLLFTVLVPGTVTVLIPYWILSAAGGARVPGIGALQALGLGLGAVGVSIYAWCVWDFASAGRGTPAPIDPPKALVVRGLYRFTRNPMYVGVLTLLVAEALFFDSPRLFLYAAAVLAMFHSFVVFYEEPTLRRSFGDAYERYCRAVPRWLPRRRPARNDPS